MNIQRRVYFSLPITAWRDGHETGLSSAQFDLVNALAGKLDSMGYTVQVFARFGILSDPEIAITPWSYEAVERVMRRCVGAIFIGVPRWTVSPGLSGDELRLPSDFSQFEAGMAVTLDLPRLVLAEEGLQPRVVFDRAHEFITYFPRDAGVAWLDQPKFDHSFQAWMQRLQQRRDVFLGYASKSADLAGKIKGFLNALGITVLDWKDGKDGFPPAGTILEQIQEAAQRCSGGIFLFTRDDELAQGKEAVPRDNVVFEAGYFAAAKGKPRVLIIREEGSKLPADLAGDIYASLPDQSDIAPIDDTIRKFVRYRL
jgi:hypothetical protein